MNIESFDPIIDWFVDRDNERGLLQGILDGSKWHRIITIEAESGLGKTWLLHHFQVNCRQRGLHHALIDFNSSRATDYLTILRAIRDSLRVDHFNAFTSLVNQYYPHPSQTPFSAQISHASSVEIREAVLDKSGISNLAGRDIIRDNFIVYPSLALPRSVIRERLTSQFVECLKAFIESLAPTQYVVWLLDSFEKADPETAVWLADEFLALIKDGTINGLVIVIAGQKVPNLGLEWSRVLAKRRLSPFTVEHFRQYLQVKKFELPESNIMALHTTFRGRPLDLAGWVDAASPTNDEWS